MAKTLRYAWNHWDNNVLKGDGTDEEFRGGDGDDQIFGSFGDDLLLGQGDNDLLLGEQGADVLFGGDGDDELAGGDGRIFGNFLDDGFDTIDGGAGDDILHFSGADAYIGGTGTDTFQGSTLVRVVSFQDGVRLEGLGTNTDQGLRMDLNAGVAISRGAGSASSENFYSDGTFVGQTMGTSTASFTSIEQYNLTNFGDYFEGDSTADTINGFGGNDVIEGKGGADIINGGSENDTIEFGSSLELVNVDLVRGTGFGGDAQGDTYTSIENIRGSQNGDALFGNAEANSILGRGGDDILDGRGGADVIDGGTGIDEVTYASSIGGVSVDLTRTTQQRGDALGDVLTNVENITATNASDLLIGDSNANTLNGRGDRDVLDGGFGNDILIGGTGVDTVTFQSHNPSGLVFAPTVNIDLTNGTATHTNLLFANGRITGTTTETDQMFSIENVTGSNFAETIRGNGETNLLIGNGGNDTLRGEGGEDLLIGGQGVDTMFGGSGSDIFLFQAASEMPTFTNGILALERIADFQDDAFGQDKIDLNAIRTDSGAHLFFNDGDNRAFEVGEVMVNTLADGRSYFSADITGDGNADFAVSFDRLITTFDSSDFTF